MSEFRHNSYNDVDTCHTRRRTTQMHKERERTTTRALTNGTAAQGASPSMGATGAAIVRGLQRRVRERGASDDQLPRPLWPPNDLSRTCGGGVEADEDREDGGEHPAPLDRRFARLFDRFWRSWGSTSHLPRRKQAKSAQKP